MTVIIMVSNEEIENKVKPTIPDVLPLAADYYAKNAAGGNLHIVLGDGNIGNDSVKYCLESAKKMNDVDGVYLSEQLLLMSKTQRNKIYKSVISQRSIEFSRLVLQ